VARSHKADLVPNINKDDNQAQGGNATVTVGRIPDPSRKRVRWISDATVLRKGKPERFVLLEVWGGDSQCIAPLAILYVPDFGAEV
jgi:hypothetical protein